MPSSLPQVVDLRTAVDHGYDGYSTIRAAIKSGVLPAKKVGGKWKINQADLEAHGQPAVRPASQPESFDDVATAVKRVVDAAPPLTDDQVRRLRELIGGERSEDRRKAPRWPRGALPGRS